MSFLKRSNLKMSGARFFFYRSRRDAVGGQRGGELARNLDDTNGSISPSQYCPDPNGIKREEGRKWMIRFQGRERGRQETDSNGQSTKIDLLRYLWPICLNRVQPDPGCIATATGPNGQQPQWRAIQLLLQPLMALFVQEPQFLKPVSEHRKWKDRREMSPSCISNLISKLASTLKI